MIEFSNFENISNVNYYLICFLLSAFGKQEASIANCQCEHRECYPTFSIQVLPMLKEKPLLWLEHKLKLSPKKQNSQLNIDFWCLFHMAEAQSTISVSLHHQWLCQLEP